MILAEVTPFVTGEITMSGLGIMVSVLASALALGWWFTRQFSMAQVSFNGLSKDIIFLKADLAEFKISQTAQFATVNIELRQQTEILRKTDVLAERVASESRRIDKFEGAMDRLEREFSMFRVGSRVSEQRQVGV